MILLIGNFGVGNIGDELILDAALARYGVDNCVVMTSSAEISQRFCELKFRTVGPFPTGFRSLMRYLLSARYRKLFKALIPEVDQVVFPGGGLLAIRTKAYWIWSIHIFWVQKLFKKKVILEHQGIDEPQNFVQRWCLKYSLGRSKLVSVRDEVSAAVVQKVSPSIVFELKTDRVVDQFKVISIQDGASALLLNARAKVDKQNIRAKIEDLNLIPTFVCFEPSDKAFAPIGWEVVIPQTKTETRSVFSRAQVVVGERLHSLVLGQKSVGSDKTYLLRAPYAKKVEVFCETHNIQVF